MVMRCQVLTLLRRAILIIATCVLCFDSSPSAAAAEIYYLDKPCGIFIVGKIEPTDGKLFHKTVIDMITNGHCLVHSVSVFSPGGDLMAAIDIGHQIRALNWSTEAPHSGGLVDFTPASARCSIGADIVTFDTQSKKGDPRCICASACFFIWASGGIGRNGDAVLLHRPYFNKEVFKNLSVVEAEKSYNGLAATSREYLSEMGVPEAIVARMFSISSTSAKYMTKEEIDTMTEVPYMAELLNAKCGALVDEDLEKSKIACLMEASRLHKKIDVCRKFYNTEQETLGVACRAEALRSIINDSAVKYVRKYGK